MYKGKQEMLLLLPLAMVVPKQKYSEPVALVSSWAHANRVPELLRRVKRVYHSTAVKELSTALATSPGLVFDLNSGTAVGTEHHSSCPVTLP